MTPEVLQKYKVEVKGQGHTVT